MPFNSFLEKVKKHRGVFPGFLNLVIVRERFRLIEEFDIGKEVFL